VVQKAVEDLKKGDRIAPHEEGRYGEIVGWSTSGDDPDYRVAVVEYDDGSKQEARLDKKLQVETG
jgi:hypothetical protein